jgi:hypothetical protein
VSSSEEVVAVCYSYRDYLKAKEAHRRQEEELRKQREAEQARRKEDKKPSRRERELVRV